MLVVMRQGATEAEIRGVIAAIEARGFKAHPIPGAQRTAIGITGNKGAFEAPVFESLPGVLEVIPVSHAYKLVSREVKAENTIVDIGGVKVGRGHARDRRRALRGRVARADADRGARGQEGRGAPAARRRLQAPDEPVRLPGARRRRPQDPGRGPRGDGAARRHRGRGPGGRRPRRALRRRHPDRRPQHAELLPAPAGREGAEARGPEARHVGDPRGVPDVGGVHPLGGELPGHPLRARRPDLLRLLPQHPRPGRGSRP